MTESGDRSKLEGVRRPLALAFRNAGLGLAAATIVLVGLDAADAGTYAILLAIGLAVVVIGSNIEGR